MSRVPTSILLVALLGACRVGYDAEAALDDAGGERLDATVGDAPLLDASTADAGCDPAATLADDFAGPGADPRWEGTSAQGGVAAIVNGRLRITLPDPSPALTSAGAITRGSYDFTGRRLSIQVPTMVDTTTHAQVFFQLLDQAPDPAHIVAFEQQNGRLQMYVTDFNVLTQTSVAYDPVEQRYWQLREDAGVIYFDTSPDGATWSNRFSSNTAFDVSAVRLQLLVGTYMDEVAPGAAEFDDLGGSVLVGASCKRR